MLKAQRSTFDSLLNTRIRLQKGLISTNSLSVYNLQENSCSAQDREAIQAAEEKAVLLAGRLGRQIGPAQRIAEYGGGWYSSYNWWGQGYGSYANAMSQVSSQAGQSSYGEGTIALGQITVTASVSVSFALR